MKYQNLCNEKFNNNIENNEQLDSEGDFSGTHLDLQVKGSRTIHGDTVTDSLLYVLTITGLVKFLAIFSGTPNWSI